MQEVITLSVVTMPHSAQTKAVGCAERKTQRFLRRIEIVYVEALFPKLMPQNMEQNGGKGGKTPVR